MRASEALTGQRAYALHVLAGPAAFAAVRARGKWNVLFLVVGGMAMVSGLTRLGVTDGLQGGTSVATMRSGAVAHQRVMVRYPRDERRSLGDLENMRIRTPDGGQVPFSQVAVVEPGRGFASIRRVDRNRTVNVTASIDPGVTSADAVIADLNARLLPEVLAGYPGVFHTFEGAMPEQRDALGGLQRGFTLALLMIFALLAVPLRSYVQPLIIISAIPFGSSARFGDTSCWA